MMSPANAAAARKNKAIVRASHTGGLAFSPLWVRSYHRPVLWQTLRIMLWLEGPNLGAWNIIHPPFSPRHRQFAPGFRLAVHAVLWNPSNRRLTWCLIYSPS